MHQLSELSISRRYSGSFRGCLHQCSSAREGKISSDGIVQCSQPVDFVAIIKCDPDSKLLHKIIHQVEFQIPFRSPERFSLTCSSREYDRWSESPKDLIQVFRILNYKAIMPILFFVSWFNQALEGIL